VRQSAVITFTYTGIPPHVEVLITQEKILDTLGVVQSTIDMLPEKTITGVVKELEARAVGLQTVTPSGVKEALESALAPIHAQLSVLTQNRGQSVLPPAPQGVAYASV